MDNLFIKHGSTLLRNPPRRILRHQCRSAGSDPRPTGCVPGPVAEAPRAGPMRFGLSCPFWEAAVYPGLLFVSTLEECGSLKRQVLPAGGPVRRFVPAQDPTGWPRWFLPPQGIMSAAATVCPFLEARSLMPQPTLPQAAPGSLALAFGSFPPGSLLRAYTGHEHVSDPGIPRPSRGLAGRSFRDRRKPPAPRFFGGGYHEGIGGDPRI